MPGWRKLLLETENLYTLRFYNGEEVFETRHHHQYDNKARNKDPVSAKPLHILCRNLYTLEIFLLFMCYILICSRYEPILNLDLRKMLKMFDVVCDHGVIVGARNRADEDILQTNGTTGALQVSENISSYQRLRFPKP